MKTIKFSDALALACQQLEIGVMVTNDLISYLLSTVDQKQYRTMASIRELIANTVNSGEVVHAIEADE